MHVFTRGSWLLALLVGLAGWGGGGALGAERPTAAELLPAETFVYFRIANAPELREKLRQTALGKIGDDPEVKPLVTRLYGSATEAFSRIQDQVGASLGELLELPQGEVAFAVVAPKQGPPQVLLLFEVGDRLPQAQKMLAKGEEALASSGAEKSTETIENTLVTIYKPANDRNVQLSFCERDGVFLVASQTEALRPVLARWSGKQVVAESSGKEGAAAESLAKSAKFNSIMSRCAGAGGDKAQLSWFIDPISGVKAGLRGNLAAQTGLALLPVLGLDGLQGAGGSALLATDDFDFITHVHLLLDNPRNGVLELLAMRGGDTTPETWVPSDSASYMTVHWDVPATWRTLVKLVDSFQGDGWLSGQAKQNVSANLGADLETEILPALGTRLSTFSWIEKPARLNGRSNLLGVQLLDAKSFTPVVDKIAARFPDNLERKSYAGVTYYRTKEPVNPPRRPRRNREEENQAAPPDDVNADPNLVARVHPCLAIVGDYLVVADRESVLERAIVAQSDASQGLAKELDFKLIASKIRRQPGGELPGMLLFDRPEEGLRMWYDLATGDTARRRLEREAEGNEFFRTIDSALKENPLPPFAVVAKYLAPSGGMMVSDETGFHYTGFTLKRK